MITTVDPSCVIGIVLVIVLCLGMLAFLHHESGGLVAPEPDVCDGASHELDADAPQEPQPTRNEPPTMNTWSAIHTSQHIYAPPATPVSQSADERMTPDEAEQFISLLEAADRDDPLFPTPRTHCPICVMRVCDDHGIPLEEVRTIGARRYCEFHQHMILAHARQGA